MSRLHRALAVLAITILTFLVAGPAAAGGPTSVLLVVPGAARTASLYTSQADYQTLAVLVGADGSTTSGAVSTGTGEGGSEGGPSVTVTWLIHDVVVWRVDRVYLSESGPPQIATQADLEGSGNIWDRPTTWHSVARRAELVALLDRLGVNPLSASGGAGRPAPTVGAHAATANAASVPQATTTDTTAAPSLRDLTWALSGVAVGVLIALVGVIMLRAWRERRSADGPTDHGLGTETDADGRGEILVL